MGWVGGTYVPDNPAPGQDDSSIPQLSLPQSDTTEPDFSSLFSGMFQQQNSQTNQKIVGTLGMTGQSTGAFKYRRIGG